MSSPAPVPDTKAERRSVNDMVDALERIIDELQDEIIALEQRLKVQRETITRMEGFRDEWKR